MLKMIDCFLIRLFLGTPETGDPCVKDQATVYEPIRIMEDVPTDWQTKAPQPYASLEEAAEAKDRAKHPYRYE